MTSNTTIMYNCSSENIVMCDLFTTDWLVPGVIFGGLLYSYLEYKN